MMPRRRSRCRAVTPGGTPGCTGTSFCVRRILVGRLAGPRGAFVILRTARVGQATPPAKETLHLHLHLPHAQHAEHGTERHNPTSPAPSDDSADGNGRRPVALPGNAVA